MPVLPMFPLGTVLLPSLVLPLHVFEPRYRQMTEDCLGGDREFGVVLIERGNEVGGGDTRTSVGTVARVVEAVPFPDGRWALATVGTRRIRVRQWLDDDPYPRAEVEDWDDPPPAAGLAGALATTVGVLRRVLATQAELGDAAAPATQELSEDPVLASYQALAISPLGAADRQALLAAPSAEDRVTRLRSLLEDEAQVLAQRLLLDDDPFQPPDGDVEPPAGR
jgi:Lon protease-like protein